jgi:hypothetical protein
MNATIIKHYKTMEISQVGADFLWSSTVRFVLIVFDSEFVRISVGVYSNKLLHVQHNVFVCRIRGYNFQFIHKEYGTPKWLAHITSFFHFWVCFFQQIFTFFDLLDHLSRRLPILIALNC